MNSFVQDEKPKNRPQNLEAVEDLPPMPRAKSYESRDHSHPPGRGPGRVRSGRDHRVSGNRKGLLAGDRSHLSLPRA